MSLSNNYPTTKPSLLLDFSNTKQLDPRITFTRTSTATYYDGVTTAMAEQNLLTYSQEFDNAAWGKTAIAVTANTSTAPDGTTTADTITADGTNSVHRFSFSQTASSTGRVVSVYLKAGTNNFAQIYFDTDSAPWANFNLSTGVVGSTGSNQTASIVDAGNGWYRCIVSTSSTTATNFNILIVTSATVGRFDTNTLATSILAWGAQSEARQTVTAYTATTTQPITNYIPVLLTAASGIPRFNHNPTTGESLGLLIEESRTNLLTYSEQFDNAAWTKTRSSITANTIVAPDGTVTGDKLVEDATASNTHTIDAALNNTSATFSVYAKAAERRYLTLRATNGSTSWYAITFDLLTGIVSDENVSSVANLAYGILHAGNGWYRCWAYTSTTAGYRALAISSVANPANNAGTFGCDSYTGDGFSGVFLWGAQLEAGSFATSYIKTEAATVTRSADAASMTGTNFSSWYNAAEGTFCADFAGGNSISGLYGRAIGYDGAGSIIGGNNDVNRVSTWNGSVNLSATFTGSVLTGVKAVMAYSSAGRAVVANGQTVATDANLIGTVTTIRLGNSVSANESLNGTLRRVAYYPRRLTNTQLQALTTV